LAASALASVSAGSSERLQTWLFEGWPDAWADETDELKEE
jgi:hypothetical protein